MTDLPPPIHASSVAYGGAAVLILGPSGAGKSALALDLICRGAALISDDRTLLRSDGEQIFARAPSAISGLIEARGVGLLRLPTDAEVPVLFVVDMAQIETERLPPPREISLMGRTLPCLRKVEAAHFPASILLCLKHGIPERT